MESVFYQTKKSVYFLGEYFDRICFHCKNTIEFKPTEKKFDIKAICPNCQTEHNISVGKKAIFFSYNNKLTGIAKKYGISAEYGVLFFKTVREGVLTSIPAPVDMSIDEDISDITVKTVKYSKR